MTIPSSNNLLVQLDNLNERQLRRLLQATHRGKVRVIYIGLTLQHQQQGLGL